MLPIALMPGYPPARDTKPSGVTWAAFPFVTSALSLHVIRHRPVAVSPAVPCRAAFLVRFLCQGIKSFLLPPVSSNTTADSLARHSQWGELNEKAPAEPFHPGDYLLSGTGIAILGHFLGT